MKTLSAMNSAYNGITKRETEFEDFRSALQQIHTHFRVPNPGSPTSTTTLDKMTNGTQGRFKDFSRTNDHPDTTPTVTSTVARSLTAVQEEVSRYVLKPLYTRLNISLRLFYCSLLLQMDDDRPGQRVVSWSVSWQQLVQLVAFSDQRSHVLLLLTTAKNQQHVHLLSK